jgi:hypothetical protein
VLGSNVASPPGGDANRNWTQVCRGPPQPLNLPPRQRRPFRRTQTVATLPRTLLLVDSALRWRTLELLAFKLDEQEQSGGALRREVHEAVGNRDRGTAVSGYDETRNQAAVNFVTRIRFRFLSACHRSY